MIKFAVKDFTASAKRLRDYIHTTHGIDGLVVKNHDKIADDDFVVNWGCWAGHGLNSRRLGGKSRVLTMLYSAGIPVPRFSTSDETMESPVDALFLVRHEHGFGGTDLEGVMPMLYMDACRTLYRQNEASFIVEYIDKIAEFRAHIAGDKVIVARKTREVGAPYESTEDVAWNHGYGYSQTEMNNLFLNTVIGNIARDSAQALGIDFGAFDIIADKYGRLYVLEFNSAPGLDMENRLKLYGDYIAGRYREQNTL